MANATLTISANGTVQGKAFSYSKTQTVDNIDTVVRRTGVSSINNTVVSFVTSGDQTPQIDQEHDITMIANHDSRATMQLNMDSSAGNVRVHLEPGCFFVIQKADAGGNINETTTATTSTCVAITQLEVGKLDNGHTAPKYGILGCFNYAS